MKEKLAYIKKRLPKYIGLLLKERSTYVGLAAILASLGVFSMSESEWVMVLSGLAGIYGVVSTVKLDKNDKERMKE